MGAIARGRGWLVGAWSARTWRGLGYLVLGLPVTALGFTMVLVAVVKGTVLSLTVVGVLVVPTLLALVRAGAWLERRRCAMLRPVAPPQRYPIEGLARRARLRVELSDTATWRVWGS